MDPSIGNASARVVSNYPIVAAASSGFLDAIHILLKDYRVSPEVEDNSALRAAFKHNSIEAAEILLSDHRVKNSVNLGEIVLEALSARARNGDIQLIPYILSRKLSKESSVYKIALSSLLTFEDKKKMGPILYILKNSENIQSRLKQEALKAACRWGDDETVRFLLRDEEVDASYQDNLPIVLAVQNGNYIVFNTLKEIESIRKEGIRRYSSYYDADLEIFASEGFEIFDDLRETQFKTPT